MRRLLWRDRSGSAASSSSRVSRLLSDTWLWEILSVILSSLFFVLIIIILNIHNRKRVPEFAYGITLNAIISTLMTFSKSSLLVAAAASISQLKWHWYRTSEGRRLFDMQLFDDANRGPLGAFQILTGVSRWSLVSVGAIVFVLAPAFDPFVQQVIAYSTQTMASHDLLSQPSNTFRAENLIVRNKNKDPFTDVYDVQQLAATSLWDSPSSHAGLPDVHCPTGNCTWPNFESLAMCTSCEQRSQDLSKSECRLSWNSSEVQNAITRGSGDFLSLQKSCVLKIPDDLPCYISPEFTIGAGVARSESDNLWYPSNVKYPNHIFGSQFTMPAGELVPNGTEHLSIAFESDISPTESGSLLSFCDLEIQRKGIRDIASLSVKQATVCRLKPCIQTYSLAVTNNTLAFSALETRYGSWSFDATGLRYWNGKLYNITDGLPYEQILFPSWTHMVGPNDGYFNLANTTSHYDFNSPYSIKHEDLHSLYNLTNLFQGQINVTDTFKRGKGLRQLNSSVVQFQEVNFALQSVQNEGTEDLNLRQVIKRGGLAQVLPHVTSRVNKSIREKDRIAVPGQSFTLVLLVNVRWGWLLLPAATWVIGIGFFFATIWVCRDDKQMLWKGSSLPLFYHGLTNEDLEVIEAMANKRDEVSSMESASKKVHVRFPKDANPPQLRLVRRMDESSGVEGGDTSGLHAVDSV